MRIFRAGLVLALLMTSLVSIGYAGDVTLISRDGTIELDGTLVGYDGEYYRIDTEYGVLTVDGSGVTCDGPGCPNLTSFVAKLAFSGASELGAGLFPVLLERFAAQRGYVLHKATSGVDIDHYALHEGGQDTTKAAEITVRRNSSTLGFADLVAGQADFVLSLREILPGERTAAREAGLGELNDARQMRVIALDAMVPVIAQENPVNRLTMEQLAKIFAGEINNWAGVGGENAPITRYLLADDTGFSDVFVSRVVRDWSDTELSPEIRRVESNPRLVELVAKDPFGIGIATFSQPGQAKIVAISGECGFDTAASIQSIKAEDYPLTVPLYLYMPARQLPKIAREFLIFLRSDEAQTAVRQAGFIDQLPVENPVAKQGRRLANAILAAGDGVDLDMLKNMAELMVDHTRLSLTFRFRRGSTTLDAPSLSNVLLLAHGLEAGWFDGQNIRFVGFSDGSGQASINMRLAKERAQNVMNAVREAAETLDGERVSMFAETFGEALPMACDDTVWGRQVNRRVEVWLQQPEP